MYFFSSLCMCTQRNKFYLWMSFCQQRFRFGQIWGVRGLFWSNILHWDTENVKFWLRVLIRFGAKHKLKTQWNAPVHARSKIESDCFGPTSTGRKATPCMFLESACPLGHLKQQHDCEIYSFPLCAFLTVKDKWHISLTFQTYLYVSDVALSKNPSRDTKLTPLTEVIFKSDQRWCDIPLRHWCRILLRKNLRVKCDQAGPVSVRPRRLESCMIPNNCFSANTAPVDEVLPHFSSNSNFVLDRKCIISSHSEQGVISDTENVAPLQVWKVEWRITMPPPNKREP